MPENESTKGKKRKAVEDDEETLDDTPSGKKRGRKAPFGFKPGKKAASPASSEQDDAEVLRVSNSNAKDRVKSEDI